jgi:predicted sugar kinase
LFAAAVLVPKYSGLGYRTSLPLNVALAASQRTLQSSIQIGHIPFRGLISGTRVLVPVVDLAFSIPFIFVTTEIS